MSEHKSNIQQVIQEANGNLDAAMQYGEETGAIRVDRINQTGRIETAETYSGGVGAAKLHRDSFGRTDVQTDLSGANYRATLGQPKPGIIAAIDTVAFVEREGYGKHRFGDNTKIRAAELIASITAKRFVSEADSRVKHMTKAQEKHRSKTSK